jgi:hypothetical protein
MSDPRINHIIKPSFFVPQPSDSIEDVVARQYEVQKGNHLLFNALVDYTMQLNPTIRSSKQALGDYTPRTLQFLSSNPHDLVCSNPAIIEARIQHALRSGEFLGIDQARQFIPHDPVERDIYGLLAKFSEEYGEKFLSTGIGVLGTMTGQRNMAIMNQLAALHDQRAIGKISQGYFKNQKKLLIDSYVKQTGSIGKLIHNEKSLRTYLHQNPSQKGISPSGKFTMEAKHMAKLARFAKGSGLILTASGVYMTKQNMCNAETSYEQNVVLVKGAGSFAGGFAGGYLGGFAISLIVASGPVGWVAALAVSGVTAFYAGDAVAYAAKEFYDRFGNKIDLASSTGINRICR